ncbi:hypothetical protein CWI36_1252p0010 [Hamiltosporidium magnivora]|uniref:Uncharacterized protein n=1 Tax=Hamiltosporidium magnivora TaxID=148818 RepID=A0A4Q9L3S9_9MICR|nr:hypothetical protein CWI36_1252p0010 [Hamiltosporidium magnivora]
MNQIVMRTPSNLFTILYLFDKIYRSTLIYGSIVPPTSNLYLCFKKDEMPTSENMNDFFQLDLSGFALSREYFNSPTYISRYHSSEFSDIGYINKNTLNLVSTFRKIEKSIELSENQRFLDMGDIKYAEWKIFYGFLQGKHGFN